MLDLYIFHMTVALLPDNSRKNESSTVIQKVARRSQIDSTPETLVSSLPVEDCEYRIKIKYTKIAL